MKTNVIMEGSFELYDAYLDVHNKILVNLARHFPYAKSVPSGSFQYQAKMLAQMGMIDKETANIIMGHMRGVAGVVKEDIERAILEGIGPAEPKLRAAAEKGFLRSSALPDPVPEQMYAFRAFYNQSIDKMNLTNTVMLDSTKEAYRATVADISQKIEELQTTLNAESASVVSGVEAYNRAVTSAVNRMVETGITGFIDHAGKHWRPEVYATMVIRTTSMNASRQAVFERNQQYGNDLYQVSTHDGARPLCYPWQAKVISRDDLSREVEDFEGNKVHVYAQSETSYGQAAGLFGINCGHYPMVFIPGFSSVRGEPQDPEENAKAYEESQRQRALERKLRDEKLTYDVEKARGADPERLRYQRQKVRDASNELDQFCKDTGRARRRYREYHPINATWPDRPDGITPPLTPPGGGWGGGPVPPTAGVTPPKVPSTPPVAPTRGYGAAVDSLPAQNRDAVAKRLDDAPENVRGAWRKAQDRLQNPSFTGDPDDKPGFAYYRASENRCHFDGMPTAFDADSIGEEYSTWFHEYGHNIDYMNADNVFSKGPKSVQWRDGEFGRTLYEECEERFMDYLRDVQHVDTDPFELIRAAQDGNGGMGMGSWMKQMARELLDTDSYHEMRSIVNAATGPDKLQVLHDAFYTYLVDEEEVMKAVHGAVKSKYGTSRMGSLFSGWVKMNYTKRERSSISDMFEEFCVDMFDIEYPFGVGHGKNYWPSWQGPHAQLAKESFAEMYSATAIDAEELQVIKKFFPRSYDLFLWMLEEMV